jgi:hypothetical protein
VSTNPPDRFRLRINVSIEKVDQYGSHSGNQLTISEDRILTVKSFAETALVLGRFHELGEALAGDIGVTDV